jgi:hypothetical protein
MFMPLQISSKHSYLTAFSWEFFVAIYTLLFKEVAQRKREHPLL